MIIQRDLLMRKTEAMHLRGEGDVDSPAASPWFSYSPHELFISALINERPRAGIGCSLLLGDNAFYVRARSIPLWYCPILCNHFHTTCMI